MTKKTAEQLLAPHPSWAIQKVSPLSYPGDILLRHKWNPSAGKLTQKQAEHIVGMIKADTCYRCRIGTGRWYYAASAAEAAKLALMGLAQRKKAGPHNNGRRKKI